MPEYRNSKSLQRHSIPHCLLFIWSVSQNTTVGWGIRLRMTLKKWHRQADLTDLIKSLVAEPEIHDRSGMKVPSCQIFWPLLADLPGQPTARCKSQRVMGFPLLLKHGMRASPLPRRLEKQQSRNFIRCWPAFKAWFWLERGFWAQECLSEVIWPHQGENAEIWAFLRLWWLCSWDLDEYGDEWRSMHGQPLRVVDDWQKGKEMGYRCSFDCRNSAVHFEQSNLDESGAHLTTSVLCRHWLDWRWRHIHAIWLYTI